MPSESSALLDVLYNVPVPAGWEKRYDAFLQQVYFYNKHTHERVSIFAHFIVHFLIYTSMILFISLISLYLSPYILIILVLLTKMVLWFGASFVTLPESEKHRAQTLWGNCYKVCLLVP